VDAGVFMSGSMFPFLIDAQAAAGFSFAVVPASQKTKPGIWPGHSPNFFVSSRAF
jgi:hypothetical protein